MPKIRSLIVLLLTAFVVQGQRINVDSSVILIAVVDERSDPLVTATIELLKDNLLVKAAITDEKGNAHFDNIAAGNYTFSVTRKGYITQTTAELLFPSAIGSLTLRLQPEVTNLESVQVRAHKPFVQFKQGKVVLNVDAAVTNAGSTVLEILEKSPGVTVDKNGSITLNGKASVLVLIDDKQTYLSGAELNNLLSSMSSAQVNEIELMTNPPARYDASGNAGIINIKTKKNKAKGFNGSFSIAAGQGVYSKNNNNLVLNYRRGKFNIFLNYSMNLNKYHVSIYALRKYYAPDNSLISTLDQFTYFSGIVFNNTVKTGIDFYATPKTTLGIVLGGSAIRRRGNSAADAIWLSAGGNVDSVISTHSSSKNSFQNGMLNFNVRHQISALQEITADVDWLKYTISSRQEFNNELQVTSGYTESSRGYIPSGIKIASAKIDHTLRWGKNTTLESGWKSSFISTDNTASYQNYDGNIWSDDYGKSNHFLYRENIHAFYSSIETKYKRFSIQAGLRYENTGYNADQLGNVQQKDSAFARHYNGLFPSGYISYRADSANGITISAGRRIDRPAFQKLNPFYFIINKYTYQTGNPFFLPQYSWNLELSHQYKNVLTSTLSYSNIKNYFSQLFLTDTAKGILFYSEGNVGQAHNIGLSSVVQGSLFPWWSVTAQANYNYKKLKGFNGNADFKSEINQLTVNVNNQFTILNKYTAEVSGFYTTRARNDLQEILYPTGQLSVGLSRQLFKKKASLKFNARDLFYSNAMEGLTQFDRATEYFIVRRDSRVFTLSFTYRFGNAYKTAKRSGNSIGDVIERVGNG